MKLEHRLSALLQLHLHSRLNTWLQWIGQRHLQDETGNIFFWFGEPYTGGFTVIVTIPTLPWPAAPQVVISAVCTFTSDGKVGNVTVKFSVIWFKFKLSLYQQACGSREGKGVSLVARQAIPWSNIDLSIDCTIMDKHQWNIFLNTRIFI